MRQRKVKTPTEVGGQLSQLHELQPPSFPPPLDAEKEKLCTLPRKRLVKQSGRKTARSTSPGTRLRRPEDIPPCTSFRRQRYARPRSSDLASSSSCDSDLRGSPSKSMDNHGSSMRRFHRYLPGNMLGGYQVVEKPNQGLNCLDLPESHTKRFPEIRNSQRREQSCEGISTDDAKEVPKSRRTRVALTEELITTSEPGNSDVGNMLSPRSKARLKHRKSFLAASSMSFQQSVVTSIRQNSRGVTRNLKQRLKDFDRRYVKSCRESRRRKKGADDDDSDQDSSEWEDEKADGEDEKAQRPDDRQKTDSAFEQALHFMDKSVLKERPLPFKVVQGSSNRGEFPPTELTRERGKWETAPLHVRNEYIIIELKHGPGTITSVSFGLPGNESSARHGRIYYSIGTIEGPWNEAWKFENRSKEAYAMKTSHDYNRLADEFRELLEKQCGGISDAWGNVLDTNADGALSYTEFCAACARLRQLAAVKKAKRGSLFEDHQRLFDSIDVDASGSVRLEDLLKKGGKLPVSSWWKLVFNNNWGSTAHLAVCSPLKIYTTVNETEEGLGLDNDLLHSGKPTYDLTRAFDLKTLDVSADQIALRQLAQKHDMPVNTLEEIYGRFCEVDCDSSGVIEKDEFHLLVLRLHGARDVMDVPRSRLKFFWQEADRNGNGEIDFDEFLDWFWNYFSKETASAASFKNTHALVENYYSSVAWPRGDANRRKSMVQQQEARDGVNVKVERKSVLKLVAASKPSRKSTRY